MSDTAVIFDIIGRDRVSPALLTGGSAFDKFALGIAAGALYATDKLTHMAADFQQGMTRLQTGAGESAKNMKLVSDGILNMAGEVGESTKDLSAGMYLVESAGFHGQHGLDVLRIAAMGAKVGNAEMATVADAVTTALNAYGKGSEHAAEATNALIAAEGQGKTTLEALSGSLSTVAPAAAVAHVGLNEVLAAMATMTAQGTPAAQAATYLRQTILQLSNPTAKARDEMQHLGLSAIDVSTNLGKNGLASTLDMLTTAIQSKMGPAGTVLIDKLRGASHNATDFQKVLANLPPTQQTFIGALADMVGGTKSMQAALELTGSNMGTFRHNIDVINEKVKAGGKNIEGWSLVQKNFNQRMSETKGQLEAVGIKIGTALLPVVGSVVKGFTEMVMWFARGGTEAKVLAGVLGAAAAGFLAYKVAMVGLTVATNAWKIATKLAAVAQGELDVAMLANPIGLIIAGILLLVAGFIYLWTHSAAFRNFWIGLWNGIKSAALAVAHWFAGPFADFFVNAWNKVTSATRAVGNFFTNTVPNFFSSAWGKIVAGGHAVGNFFTVTIPGWGRAVLSELGKLPGQLGNLFLSGLNRLAFIAGYALGMVVREFMALPGQVVAVVKFLWNLVVALWTGSSNAVASFVVSWISRIIAFFQALPGRVSAFVSSLWSSVVSLWNAGTQRVEAFASALPGRIMGFLAPLPGRIGAAFTSAWNSAYNATANAVSRMISAVESLPGKFASLGSAAVHGLINGVENAAGALYGVASSMASHFLSGFKSALGIHSPSTVFQIDVAQKGIGAGLIQGIVAQESPVRRAAATLAAKTVEPFSGKSLASGPTTAGSGGGSRQGSGQTVVKFAGNVDSAFATAFMKLVRNGMIQISVS